MGRVNLEVQGIKTTVRDEKYAKCQKNPGINFLLETRHQTEQVDD
jgi:hypothetical protein